MSECKMKMAAMTTVMVLQPVSCARGAFCESALSLIRSQTAPQEDAFCSIPLIFFTGRGFLLKVQTLDFQDLSGCFDPTQSGNVHHQNEHLPHLSLTHMAPTFPAGPVLHQFTRQTHMAQAVAQTVADQLKTCLQRRVRATLVVSGGKTPVCVWELLREVDLPWERVDITLADERWVPVAHPDSNEALVRQHLLQSRAAQACWWPLYDPVMSLEEAARQRGEWLKQHLGWPADVVMLGMGQDGHTASWFPGQAMPHDDRWCMSVPAPERPNVQQPRLSLTPRALLDATCLLLVVQGADKEDTLGKAMQPTSGLPVSQALWQSLNGAEVFFCK